MHVGSVKPFQILSDGHSVVSCLHGDWLEPRPLVTFSSMSAFPRNSHKPTRLAKANLQISLHIRVHCSVIFTPQRYQ